MAFDAATPGEKRSKERFLEELDRLEDPFDRDSSPIHVTASGIAAAVCDAGLPDGLERLRVAG